MAVLPGNSVFIGVDERFFWEEVLREVFWGEVLREVFFIHSNLSNCEPDGEKHTRPDDLI